MPADPCLPVEQRIEWLACRESPAYFLDRYGQILDSAAHAWLPFHLWPGQVTALQTFSTQRQVVVLKARQLGLSWLAVGYALWLMLFRPVATVLFTSRRDVEATDLVDARLKGMYKRLPPFLQCRLLEADSKHLVCFSNGSSVIALPPNGGRAYAASLAVVDEADHIDDLDGLLDAVKPTVEAGGSLLLLSTVNKGRPNSPFQRIFKAARLGQNGFAPLFLPWHARPGRTPAWYDGLAQEIRARTGVLDALYAEYPATETEALASRTAEQRFPTAWLSAAAEIRPPLPLPVGAATGEAGWRLFELPEGDASYVIAADPAEGNQHSDESAATVVEVSSGRQVGVVAGRYPVEIFAEHLMRLSRLYNGAPVLVERNNHGHAVNLWLAQQRCVTLLRDQYGRIGWLSTARSKAEAFVSAGQSLAEGAARIRDQVTLDQLMSIRASLRAPEGQYDDRAMAYVLALTAINRLQVGSRGESRVLPPVDEVE